MLSVLFYVCLLGVPSPSPAKLVVVSVDAGSDQIVDELLARGVLPADGAFGRIVREGRAAEYLRPVNVSSTASSHAALFTGAAPGQNGIVLNRFFQADQLLGRPINGFGAALEAETIFQAVRRAALKVICAPAVTADAGDDARRCSETMPYPNRLANAAWFSLQNAAGEAQVLPGHPGRWRPVQATGGNAAITWFKGTPTPLTLWLEADAESRLVVQCALAGQDVVLDLNQWQWWRLQVQDGLVEPWLRFDRDSAGPRLYVGQVYGFANPQDPLMQRIFSRFGGWPGEPDHRALADGIISRDEWRAQSLRQNQYLTRITHDILARDDWQVLFTYLPHVDDVQHHFMLRSPRQLDYHAENGARRLRANGEMEAAYQRVDAWLAGYMDAAPAGTRFLILSDHGMVPTHDVLFLEPLLRQWGFVKADGVTVRFASVGPSAFFYADGADATRQTQTLAALYDKLKALRDPVDGHPLFEVVARDAELAALGLQHSRRSGQIFVNARTGWSLSMRTPPSGRIMLPNSFHRDVLAAAGLSKADQDFVVKLGLNEGGLGVHGHLNHNRMVQALFYLWQPGVAAGPLGVVDALQVAPTIAALLGIDPPQQAKAPAVPIGRP